MTTRLDEPYVNEFFQTINPGDEVLMITDSYPRVSSRLGRYLYKRVDDKKNVTCVVCRTLGETVYKMHPITHEKTPAREDPPRTVVLKNKMIYRLREQ